MLHRVIRSKIEEAISVYAVSILESDIAYLSEILVTTPELIPAEVTDYTNGKIKTVQRTSCAIASIYEEKFAGLIILSKDDLPSHSREDDFHFHATLVEELIHIHQYIGYWKFYGYLHYEFEFTDPCASRLFPIAMSVLDEYIIGSRISERVMARKEFPQVNPVPKLIDRNLIKIAGAVLEASSGEFGSVNAESKIITALRNGIFIPLTRDITDQAGEEAIGLSWNMSESNYYEKHVSVYWKRLVPELEFGYKSSPEIKDTLLNIIEILREFLASLGVGFRITKDGDCELMYDDHWAIELTSGTIGKE